MVGGGGAGYWNLDGSGNIYNSNGGKILLGTNAVGPGFVNIKTTINFSGLFMSETGTTSADFISSGIYSGGGTPSTRFGNLLGNFGGGFTIAN